MKTSTHESFVSRWGLILSVLGIAIGTGNIWRFPRIVANNGGEDGAGAFLIAWLTFLLLWSIPLIIAEYAIGRNGRRGVIGSFIALSGEKFAWMGSFVGFVAMAIMFYYSVVTGWCFYYFGSSLLFPLPENTDAAFAVWNGFQSGWLPLVFHALAMALAAAVVLNGVRAIERVNKVLIPVLLVILLISFVRAVSLPGSMDGIRYLFTPDWATLKKPELWLEALTQNAWDTGAGWGLILTYAAYMKSRDNVTISALQTGIGNNFISLFAAVIIFSTVFGTLGGAMSDQEVLYIMQESGPASTGLTFIWMPQLFLEVPAGRIFAVMFFLALSFAAFSSLISMVELSSKVFVDIGVSRKKAAISICGAGFLLGMPSALNLNIFANQDFVWGLGLMLSGAFIAFIAVRYDVKKFTSNLVNTNANGLQSGRWLGILIKYIIPLEVFVLLSWWIYRSAVEFSPDGWYNPFDTYSVATVLIQWGVVLGLFYLFNKTIARLHR
ncbi:MAG: sodium-dependent transporter [Bacteroidetes bacterium]|nr:sodium-dependent transporter [Bacteroidota bacterium]MCH8524624.1 sodium-dependent transporter [Balneolales bacterium]